MKRLCFWKSPNLKNYRVEMHTATHIKPKYLATLAIWTYSPAIAKEVITIPYLPIFLFRLVNRYQITSKTYHLIPDSIRKSKSGSTKTWKKKKEKLVAKLTLMWLSRFQLSSPHRRPSPSSTLQVFSVHPSLSSTSSPSSYALVGPLFIFLLFYVALGLWATWTSHVNLCFGTWNNFQNFFF